MESSPRRDLVAYALLLAGVLAMMLAGTGPVPAFVMTIAHVDDESRSVMSAPLFLIFAAEVFAASWLWRRLVAARRRVGAEARDGR